jgi:FAD/FMN-containing dehydrogenase
VFNARDPHFLVEILPLSSSLEVFEELREWGQRFYDALMKTDPANIYPISYIPLTPDERLDLKVIYGNRYETLKKVKQQYDPKNVFKHSVVRP